MIEPFGTIKIIQPVDYPSWRGIRVGSECNCFFVPQDFLDQGGARAWTGCAGIWVSFYTLLQKPNDLGSGFLRIKDMEGNDTHWLQFFDTAPPYMELEHEYV